MKRENDPCIFHRSVPMNRLDLLPAQPVNTSGIYSKPARQVRVPTRPTQVGVMLQDVKTRTGIDLRETFIAEYQALPPTPKDLVDFKPYYKEPPIIGGGGFVNRPTLNQQTYLNIINQLNLAPPTVGSGSALTLATNIVPVAPALTLAQINELPLPMYNAPPPRGPPPPYEDTLSDYTPPSSGSQTPAEVGEQLTEDTRQTVLEDRRQTSLGNTKPPSVGFGKLPIQRPAPLNPKQPLPSRPKGSNIMSTLSQPFSRFTTARAKISPYSSQQQSEIVVEPGSYERM